MEIYHPSSGQLIRRYGSAVVQKLKQILAVGHQQAFQGCFCSQHFSEASQLVYQQSLDDLQNINTKIAQILEQIKHAAVVSREAIPDFEDVKDML